MIKLLLTFLAAFVVLFITTLLFDWTFIASHITRQILVALLLLIETAVFAMIIYEIIKELKQ